MQADRVYVLYYVGTHIEIRKCSVYVNTTLSRTLIDIHCFVKSTDSTGYKRYCYIQSMHSVFVEF